MRGCGVAGRLLTLAALLPAMAAAAQTSAPGTARSVFGPAVEVARVRATRAAIDVLPGPLRAFYKAHRLELPSQAVEPDLPPRSPDHRFLVDRLLPFPFVDLPRSEAALVARFGERAREVGRLPWLVQESYARLVDAMRTGDRSRILVESDTLAGLIVDLHTVVNLTDNFDGQKSGQHGLYVRITDKLPQVLSRDLDLSPEPARYLDDPKEYVFSMLLASYVWLDNTLYLDALAKRGKTGYGEIYFEDLARRMKPILRERLTSAAEDVASYWYTAWTVAGRPALK